MKNKETGKTGEDLAFEYLKAKGFYIIDRNVRNKLGEIDIIATFDDELIFVEVKSMTKNDIFDPMDHITPQKQKKLLQLAQAYTSNHHSDMDQRIDIILVHFDQDHWSIEHFEDVITF